MYTRTDLDVQMDKHIVCKPHVEMTVCKFVCFHCNLAQLAACQLAQLEW